MNKTIKRVFSSAAILFMLPGCASKVTYAEFRESFDKIEPTSARVESMKIKGKYKGESVSFSFSETNYKDITASDAVIITAFTVYSVEVTGLILEENKDCTYYAGSTYKLEYKDKVFELSGKGELTSVKDGDDTSLSFSYSYAK